MDGHFLSQKLMPTHPFIDDLDTEFNHMLDVCSHDQDALHVIKCVKTTMDTLLMRLLSLDLLMCPSVEYAQGYFRGCHIVLVSFIVLGRKCSISSEGGKIRFYCNSRWTKSLKIATTAINALLK